MIWCRFEDNGTARFGVVEGDHVTPVNGSPFDGYESTSDARPLAAVKLLPPTNPYSFFCVGLNYHGHFENVRRRSRSPEGPKVPQRPEVGYRFNSALVGDGDEIVMPADLPDGLECEPEVVAVMGRRIRNATREEAREAILGWTIGADVSARPWQQSDRTFWRAKNSDTFSPMGPWIATDANPWEATTSIRLNGDTASSFSTGDMIFDPIDFIVAITEYITMQPGDVLWMGADGAVPIKPGDAVEIDISGIGVLHNNVVRAPTRVEVAG
jgi:2-keto-4-pentenoate hydratase/2-oxohepta-3-ene-1,7-dioic acid hydratase in catechol pathway